MNRDDDQVLTIIVGRSLRTQESAEGLKSNAEQTLTM